MGYLSKGLKAAGAPLDAELTMGLAVPVVAAVVYLAVRRARRHIVDDGH